jgi:uncharacterized membrane protein
MAKHPRWARRFLSDEDFDAIARAIAQAEAHTSGEIRVHLERRIPPRRDVLRRAHEVLRHLGMHQKTDRHGVLIYLALEDRKLAIVGDEGIHRRVGDGYWARVRDLMVEKLKAGASRDAILAAIHDVGRVLREHFPRRPGDSSELSDQVSVE